MRHDALFSSASDEWTTPKYLFDELTTIFGFARDAAATAENSLCEFHSVDGLNEPWVLTTWCNPPYSQIKQWVAKASSESVRAQRAIVLLIPARTDTKIWHEYIFGHANILFIKGRLKFGESKNSAPFPSALIIYNATDIQLTKLANKNMGYLI